MVHNIFQRRRLLKLFLVSAPRSGYLKLPRSAKEGVVNVSQARAMHYISDLRLTQIPIGRPQRRMGGCVTLNLAGECGRGGGSKCTKILRTSYLRSAKSQQTWLHKSLPPGRNLAALICRLPLRRQADGVRPAARAATSAAVRAASAADERPPGEAEVALLDAVPAVLQAVLAALDLVVNLQGRNSIHQ